MYWWIWLIICLFFLGMAAKSFFDIKKQEIVGRRRQMFNDF